jgi:hypothetical protein
LKSKIAHGAQRGAKRRSANRKERTFLTQPVKHSAELPVCAIALPAGFRSIPGLRGPRWLLPLLGFTAAFRVRLGCTRAAIRVIDEVLAANPLGSHELHQPTPRPERELAVLSRGDIRTLGLLSGDAHIPWSLPHTDCGWMHTSDRICTPGNRIARALRLWLHFFLCLAELRNHPRIPIPPAVSSTTLPMAGGARATTSDHLLALVKRRRLQEQRRRGAEFCDRRPVAAGKRGVLRCGLAIETGWRVSE